MNVKTTGVYVMELVKILLDRTAASAPLDMYLIQKEKCVLVRFNFVIHILILLYC